VNLVAPLGPLPGHGGPLEGRAGRWRWSWSPPTPLSSLSGLGGYGAAKSAVEQLAAVLRPRNPVFRCGGSTPGDLRTQMHQAAFPRRGHLGPALPDTSWHRSCASYESGGASGACGSRRRRHRFGLMTAALSLERSWIFELPAGLEASSPPEERGRGRDDVRLLVRGERPRGSSTGASRTYLTCSVRATCWSSTPPRPSRPPLPARWRRTGAPAPFSRVRGDQVVEAPPP